jgi:DNA-binding CsgD family transcriptional regulator
MPATAKSARTAGDRARSALTRLAGAGLDNDSFRYEAVAVLRQAVGFDWWCWPLLDPGTRLPTRYVGVESPADEDYRRFCRLLIDPGAWGDLGAWAGGRNPGTSPARSPRIPAVAAISTATGGDLSRDLLWREMLGPAGASDVLNVMLPAGGMYWGQLHLGRDRPGRWFREDEERLLTGLAPLIAARLRDGLRAPRPAEEAEPDSDEPGTIFLAADLSLVGATDEAWRWIGRLGMPRLNDAEPLPGFVYAVAARVAASASRPPKPVRVRLQDAFGRWAVVRAARLAYGTSPGAQGGYAVTLEQARSEDLAPLLMRAWALSPRERDVARLVLDGLSNEDIAAALFISANTVRDHLKAIFGKTGVTRRRDLTAALAGLTARSPA